MASNTCQSLDKTSESRAGVAVADIAGYPQSLILCIDGELEKTAVMNELLRLQYPAAWSVLDCGLVRTENEVAAV